MALILQKMKLVINIVHFIAEHVTLVKIIPTYTSPFTNKNNNINNNKINQWSFFYLYQSTKYKVKGSNLLFHWNSKKFLY